MSIDEIEKIIQDTQTAALNKGAVIRCLSFSKYQNKTPPMTKMRSAIHAENISLKSTLHPP
jgi:hypothetical protein